MYFYIRTFQSISAVLNIAVFSSSLMSCFPYMLFRHFLNDSEVAQIARCIAGINFVFIFQVNSIYILRSFYFKTLLAFFLISLASPQIAMSLNRSISISLSRIVKSALF